MFKLNDEDIKGTKPYNVFKSETMEKEENEPDSPFTIEKKEASTERKKEEPEYIKKVREYIGIDEITDIHVTEGKPLSVRLSGEIIQTEVHVPKGGPMEVTDKVFHQPAWNRDNSSGGYKGTRCRMRMSKTLQKQQLFIRILPGRAPNIYALNYGDLLKRELLNAPVKPGIVVVAGATGSGKSTLLASILQYIIDNKHVHVMSVEDPVEYILYDDKGVGTMSQREIPDDVYSFDKAVVNAMREDPDVILIGEIRDAPTAVAALQAAETGHLVFTTIHAASIPGIIGRMLGLLSDTDDPALRLSEAIRGCIYLSLTQDKEQKFHRMADILWFDKESRKHIRNKEQYYNLDLLKQSHEIPFKALSKKNVSE